MAWVDNRDGNSEIDALSPSTGERRRLTNDLLMDQAPAVGDGVIAWERCDLYVCEIFTYDRATQATTQLTSTPYYREEYPDVSGHVGVFQRAYGTPIQTDLVPYDLDTRVEKVLPLRIQGQSPYTSPHISGDFIVFSNIVGERVHIGLWQLSTGDHFQVGPDTSKQ